jgi:two-component system sensor histidine kinase RegB|tara:strand:- start:2004 stop:3308 length:1305 start_codon:yes stop_codon:yes gene_type:complete
MTIDDTYQTSATARQNLRRLSFIRGLALLGQFVALIFFSFINPIGLPIVPISAVLFVYAVLTVSTWLRSRLQFPIVDQEFFAHLIIDIAFFSLLLYLSGGASNPFISYFLIPVSIAATTLPRALSICTALSALSCYSLLLYYYVPLEAIAPMPAGHLNHSDTGASNLHILGMWANFSISTLIITYFITSMASTLKRQQRQISDQREIQLRDEQLLAVGTLAAGTAHELGTPLNTMKLIVDELIADTNQPEPDLTLLNQQIEICKATLKRLLMTAEESQSSQHKPRQLHIYFSELVERWQLMRPSLNASIEIADAPMLALFHPTIDQSILNLLNNAADASPEKVEISIDWTRENVTLDIRDYGAGLDPLAVDELGKPFVTDKSNGLGLGLFLSRATLTRYGGTVKLQNTAGGGTHTQIVLPLQSAEHNPWGDELE